MSRSESLGRRIGVNLVILLPIISGMLFIVGSAVYWPTFKSVDPAVAGIMFIIGSSLLLFAEILSAILDPMFTPVTPFRNIGCLKSLFNIVGDAAFAFGSVYFLPSFDISVGENTFIAASILLLIPQVLMMWGVSIMTPFTVQFYFAFRPFKKALVFMALMGSVGCLCFIVGCFLFLNIFSDAQYFFLEAVVLFLIGSTSFLLAGVAGLDFKRERLLDPLRELHQEIIRTYRNH